MRRDGAAMVMIALAFLGLRLGLTAAMLDYVKPFMRWPIVASALLLLALGVWELFLSVGERRDGRAAAGALPDHGHDHHGHGSGGPKVTWLLLAPVVVTLVVAPGALGADAVRRALPSTLVPVEELAALPAPVDGAHTLPLAEFAARSVGPEGMLDGRRVRLTGFTVRDGSETWLARFSLTCCAADARAYQVLLLRLENEVADNTWVTVVGRWQPSDRGREHRAELVVQSVDVIERPINPYE